jgi:hypothetical protein
VKFPFCGNSTFPECHTHAKWSGSTGGSSRINRQNVCHRQDHQNVVSILSVRALCELASTLSGEELEVKPVFDDISALRSVDAAQLYGVLNAVLCLWNLTSFKNAPVTIV